MKLTWYGRRVYDVVHQNIVFEAQLKDGGALDLPSGTLRVLCIETDDIHLHLLKGVGYIIDALPNNPWVVGDCGNYAQRAFDEDMLDAKNRISISFTIWNRWTGGLWFGELGLDG